MSRQNPRIHALMEGVAAAMLAIVVHGAQNHISDVLMLHYTHVVCTFLWVVLTKDAIVGTLRAGVQSDVQSLSAMCVLCDIIALTYVFARPGHPQIIFLYAFIVSFAISVSAWGAWGASASARSANVASPASARSPAIQSEVSGAKHFDMFAKAAIQRNARTGSTLRVRIPRGIPRLNFHGAQ